MSSMTGHAISIRPYEPADQPQIDWLYARTPPAGQIAVQAQIVPVDLQQIVSHYAHFLVATQMQRGTEAIVGMLGIEKVGVHGSVPLVPSAFDLPSRTGRLRHVAVAPERWHTGIGRHLVDTAIAWLGEHGYEAVILETTPQQEAAVALYLDTGFQEIGRSMVGIYELIWFMRSLPEARAPGI